MLKYITTMTTLPSLKSLGSFSPKNSTGIALIACASLLSVGCGADSRSTDVAALPEKSLDTKPNTNTKPIATDFTIAGSSAQHTLTLTNPLAAQRNDEVVFIPASSLPSDFVMNTHFVVLDGNIVLHHEWAKVAWSDSKELAIQISMAPNEEKTLALVAIFNGALESRKSPNTYAELGVRLGGRVNDKGRFTGGEYVGVESFTLPKDHTIGNKLFKYEGFGWESELVGYRYYFDNRGAIDVFAKQRPGLVLESVGLDGGDYHALAPWGMDVLKVGASLGLGAVAAKHNNDIVKVTEFDSSKATIANGSVFSSVTLEARAWLVGNKSYDLSANYRIAGGSRLTEVIASASDSASKTAGAMSTWATGIVDHSVSLIDSQANTGKWCYRASFGKQSLNDDNLGMALFYECKQKQLENELNIAVGIDADVAHYYFLAAWEAQSNEFATQAGFVAYLNSVQTKLNTPIKITSK